MNTLKTLKPCPILAVRSPKWEAQKKEKEIKRDHDHQEDYMGSPREPEI